MWLGDGDEAEAGGKTAQLLGDGLRLPSGVWLRPATPSRPPWRQRLEGTTDRALRDTRAGAGGENWAAREEGAERGKPEELVNRSRDSGGKWDEDRLRCEAATGISLRPN